MRTILFFTTWSPRGGGKAINDGALAEAARLGFHLQVVEREPTRTLLRELRGLWHPAGAIANCGGDWNSIDVRLFGTLPTVTIGHAPDGLPPGAPSVRHDAVAVARAAALELLATGVRSFAFVPSAYRRHWSEERGKAFARAVGLHGLECRAMAPDDAGMYDTGWHRRLRAFLRTLPKPCALFAANDMVGAEVLAAARFEGIEVPGDLAVCGVDDNAEICEHTEPTLSSVAPDFRQGGVLAVRSLAEILRGGGSTGGVRTYGVLGLVRRDSTRPLASRDSAARAALTLIRREACSGLRSERVAALFPCARRTADLRFRKAVGHSIGDEIHAVQLAEAKRLAADPSRQLKSIADFCGFGSPGALRNFFRRETGMSLSTWRKSLGRGGEGRLADG